MIRFAMRCRVDTSAPLVEVHVAHEAARTTVGMESSTASSVLYLEGTLGSRASYKSPR